MWWWEHISDIIDTLITAMLAGSLILLAFVLHKWPPPSSRLRGATVATSVVAGCVVFIHDTTYRLAPWPRIFVASSLLLLAITMLRHRAGVVAKQETMNRRCDD